jgi:hypothetical protein
LRRRIAESPRFALEHDNAQEVARAVEMALGKRTTQATAQALTGNSLNLQESAAVKEAAQSLVQAKRQQKVSWRTLFTTRHFLIWLTRISSSSFSLKPG